MLRLPVSCTQAWYMVQPLGGVLLDRVKDGAGQDCSCINQAPLVGAFQPIHLHNNGMVDQEVASWSQQAGEGLPIKCLEKKVIISTYVEIFS